MNRLVAFGCSFTYGDELPNCASDTNNPSKHAWPQLAADMLGLECVNQSMSGIGNKHILYNILSFEFDPTDTVAIMWSYFNRHCIINDDLRITDLGSWFAKKNKDRNEDFSIQYQHDASYAYYLDPGLQTESDDLFNNLMCINYANSYLTNKNISPVNLSIPKTAGSILFGVSAIANICIKPLHKIKIC